MTLHIWLLVRTARQIMVTQRGDLSTYIAQGVMALAAISLTGVVLVVFGAVGSHLQSIINAWINVPVSTGY